MPFTK